LLPASWLSSLAAFGVALIVALLLGGPVIGWLGRVGYRQHVRDDGPQRHLGKAGTPTAGGIIIWAGIVVGTLVAALAQDRRIGWVPVVLVVTATAFALIGFLDDFRMIRHQRSLGLKARYKLGAQFALAALFVAAALWFGRGSAPFPRAEFWSVFAPWIMWTVWVFFIAGTSNAANLTDGLDGLAAGISAMVSATLGVLAHAHGAPGAALFCFAMTGACVGFLFFNRHPARIFMGDTGSLMIGAGLAGAAILSGTEVWLLLAGAILFIEAASVMIQVISFKSTGRRVFRMAPLHHHFELSGWSEMRVVRTAWILTAALAALTLVVAHG
jgi:phospho-N-acetylmuramoyl-pentapeptide-transferase